jgi:N-sulfoglucosamine sulfohydrolase
MSRTFSSALLVALVAVPSAISIGSPDSRPNIVLIVSDDHGREAIGCYGNPVVRTPSLDALAADGTRFTRAFCTTASCSPSRSVILTGQQNHRNGMYGLQHDDSHFSTFDNVKSLPVRLAEAGYRTARVGKFHVAPESVYAFQTVLSPGAANDPGTIGRSPVEMAELSRPIITAKDDRPFFLYYATDDPHRMNAVLPNGRPTFETYPKPNSFGNRPEGRPGITRVTYRPEEVIVPHYLPDTPDTRAELAEYYQSISRMDQGIGHLIEELRQAGKYESTLIIYISDNGAPFPGAKTTLYDVGMELPCIVRTPGRRHPGAIQDGMVTWADIVPTILDVAGVRWNPADMDGHSFRAGLDGTPLRGFDEVYASHTFHSITMYYPMRVVRTARYKLIVNIASPLPFPNANDLIHSPTWIGAEHRSDKMLGLRSIEQFLHRPKFELYDIQTDPDEIHNLADDPAHQAIKSELTVKLKAWQTVTQDPWVYKWNYE